MLRILGTGSSSMVGRGDGGPPPSRCDSRVQVWNNANPLGSNGTQFIAPPALGNAPWDPDGGNNVALWFAHRAAIELNEEVRLVVVAKGGSSISAWDTESGEVYQEIETVYPLTGLDPADIMLWFQAGDDETLGTTEEVYKGTFLDMVAALQADDILAEDAIILMATPAVAPTIAGYAQELADENSLIQYASPIGLHTFDGTHLQGASSHYMGYTRFWEVYSQQIGHPRVTGVLDLSTL